MHCTREKLEKSCDRQQDTNVDIFSFLLYSQALALFSFSLRAVKKPLHQFCIDLCVNKRRVHVHFRVKQIITQMAGEILICAGL